MTAESAPDLRQAQETEASVTSSQEVSVAASPATSLWHHDNFLKLWLSETISQFGSQFSGLAIPLTAVLVLKATPLQMGLLFFTGTLPFLLFGLFVGVWVDRHKRRPILVYSNLGRAVILGLIPVVYLL